MKGSELYRIIEQIERGENITLGEIAEKAGVARANLSTVINSDEKSASFRTVNRIAHTFPKYFKALDKKPATESLPKPPEGNLDLLRLNATLQALIDDYCQQLEALTGENGLQIQRRILEKASDNLIVRLK